MRRFKKEFLKEILNSGQYVVNRYYGIVGEDNIKCWDMIFTFEDEDYIVFYDVEDPFYLEFDVVECMKVECKKKELLKIF